MDLGSLLSRPWSSICIITGLSFDLLCWLYQTKQIYMQHARLLTAIRCQAWQVLALQLSHQHWTTQQTAKVAFAADTNMGKGTWLQPAKTDLTQVLLKAIHTW